MYLLIGTYGRVVEVLLRRIAMDIYAPELTTHLALSHARNIRMAEELLPWVEFVVTDAVMKFNSQEPWQVVVSIDKRGCLEDSLSS